MIQPDKIQRDIQLRSIGVSDEEFNFLKKNFDKISKFFKKVSTLKNDFEPKNLTFVTPEAASFRMKGIIIEVGLFLFTALLNFGMMTCYILTLVCQSGLTAIVISALLVIASMLVTYLTVHFSLGSSKLLDRIAQKICSKDIDAIFSETHRKHLEEIGKGFGRQTIRKFIQCFYPDIYEKVFNSGWFYTDARQELAACNGHEELVGYKFVVRKRSESYRSGLEDS